MSLQGVLFDLDGTFLDTAPDMAWALNALRREEGLPDMAFEAIRPEVSNGARGLLRIGFARHPGDTDFERLRSRYLDIYAENLAVHTRAFAGIDGLLDSLEAQGLRWGIVTNKPRFLAEPLMRALGYWPRAACLVAGDDHPERKPKAGPMLMACEQAGIRADACVYVGDAARDIEAGKNAGMGTIAALYGYIPPGEDPADWLADEAVSCATELPVSLGRWR
ncbi:MAG: HAD-IA family hydrolase [Gammaproteobacteria bacterium]|nr:HAD-IA family hydrolase [Gammaproteobacteria bacterium]